MAKLRLNKEDKNDIMADVSTFVTKKYDESVLGEERRAITAEIQAIADGIVAELIPDNELDVLIKHGCIMNYKEFEYKLYPTKEAGCSPKITSSEIYYSKFKPFSSIKIVLPLPADYGRDTTCDKIKSRLHDALNRNPSTIPERLWNVTDKMECEAAKIVQSYRSALEKIRFWEDAVASLNGLEKMVKPETIKRIYDEKNVCPVVELDPQVILFGKEVAEEPLAKKEKKSAGPNKKKR